MARTDPSNRNNLLSLLTWTPCHRFWREALCGCTALFFAGFLATSACHSQDVAAAAKEEQSRKQAEAKKQKHVYTEEDLKRPQILTPEDRARVEARQKEQPSPANAKPTEPLDASGNSAQIPLGDVARRFRKEKQEARVKPPTVFHMPVDEPALASPIVPALPATARPRVIAPLSAPILTPSRRPNMVAPTPNINSAPLRRIDPFAKRLGPMAPPTAVAPARPVVTSPPVAPATVVPARPIMAAPNANSVARTLVPIQATRAGTILVERGDSLWKLAERTIGRGSQWKELLAANPQILNPDMIVAGVRLNLPAAAGGSGSPTKITVQIGDTLSKIAQAHYGRLGAWRCIAQANPQIADANRIFEGDELLLPPSCKP